MITFTYEVLEERIGMLHRWFDRSYSNLQKQRQGTPAYKKWLDDCVHVIREIFDLEDTAKNAPRENPMQEQTKRAAAPTTAT